MNSVKLCRLERGLSLTEAARASGVGRTTLSRLENGHTGDPSADVLKRLANTYRVSVAELLGLTGEQAA